MLPPPGKVTAAPSIGDAAGMLEHAGDAEAAKLPRFFASRRRRLKPSTSASASALSSTVAKSPLSKVVPIAVLYGIAKPG